MFVDHASRVLASTGCSSPFGKPLTRRARSGEPSCEIVGRCLLALAAVKDAPSANFEAQDLEYGGGSGGSAGALGGALTRWFGATAGPVPHLADVLRSWEADSPAASLPGSAVRLASDCTPDYAQLAAARGGRMEGPVPPSYFGSCADVHRGWLVEPGSRHRVPVASWPYIPQQP